MSSARWGTPGPRRRRPGPPLSRSLLPARLALAPLFVVLATAGCALGPQPIPSLPETRLAVTELMESGRYEAAIDRALGPARRHLRRLDPGVERPALVLDIDETSLSNWGYEVENDFCWDVEAWGEWVLRAEAVAIAPTLELYRRARRQGVTVFFVTARRERFRAPTAENLRSEGYVGWEELFLKPDDYDGTSADYKAGARREISGRGYTIVLNVGDRPSDLAGGWAEETVLLPNPLYGDE